MDGSISYHICALCSLISIAGKCPVGGQWVQRELSLRLMRSLGQRGMLVHYAALTVMLRSASALALTLASPRAVT
jgi:hypothetical protein